MTFLNGEMNNFRKLAAGLMIVMIAIISALIITGSDAYAESTLKRKDRVWFGGETWIVINADRVANYKTNEKGILLLSEYVLEGSRMYDTTDPQGGWDGSIIQIYLKDLFEKQIKMTETEKSSVLTACKQGGESNDLVKIGLTGDRFFLLDVDEVYNDMQYNGMIINPEMIPVTGYWAPRRGGQQTSWWLRGNVKFGDANQGAIVDNNSITAVNIGKNATHGVRPAFYLNPDTVQSFDKDSDGIYVITFKDGSKSTDDAVGAMVLGVRELKRWNNTEDARWLYYGASNSKGDPARWRVIGYDGSGTHNTPKGVLSLFANTFEYSWFGPNNRYCDSVIKKYLDDLASKLPKGELDAIKKRTLLTDNYVNPGKRVDGVAGDKVEDAVYWPLSCFEADAVADAIKIDDSKEESWLRSPGAKERVALIVYYSNVNMVRAHQDESSVTPDKYASYRPVCWLMADKVLFTTPAVGGKESGQVGPDALKSVRAATTNEWKATITDEAHAAFAVKPLEKLICDGSEAVLSYSGAVIGENEYISAIIIDKYDDIRYYGRLKNCTSANDSSGKIHVRLDDKLKDGDKIYFFNEQLNGDKKTDFASELKEVTITSGHDYEFNGFEWVGSDGNGYTEVYAKYKCSNTKCGAETKVKATLDAKVTNPTCLDKGKTEYEAKVAWADSLDGKEHTQSYAVDKNALGHSFTNYVSNNDATCTNDGTKTAKCDRCDAKDTQPDVGSARGHSFTNYVSNNDAKCTEDGTKTAKCDRCDETDTQPDLGTAKDHKWKFDGFDWKGDDKEGYTSAEAKYVCENDSDHKDTVSKVTVSINEIKPTCTEDGKIVYTSKVEKADSLDDTEHSEDKDAKITPKLGHKWKFDGFEWDGNDNDGYTSAEAKYICENDPDHKDTVSKVTISVNEIKPTCLAGGKTIYTAIIVNTDSLDFTEHSDFKEAKAVGLSDHSWEAATCTEPKTCSVCHVTEGEPAGHQWMDATCTEPKTCSVCHATEGEPLGHKWDEGVVSKEPTAAEYGEKTFTCTVCKAVRTETIPMLKPDEKEAEEAKEDEDLPIIDIEKADTMGNFKKKQVKIVFPTDSKVDNYRVQYRIAGKKSWTSDWSAGTGIYTVKNLKKSSLLEFRIAGYARLEDGTWIRSKWSKISYRYMSSVPLKTVKAGKKKITVTYKKDGKSGGYRIQYALKKNMNGRKVITVKGKSKTKCTIKGLKKGKTYFIKVRPIIIKSGTVYIGILSGTKKATVK